MRSKQYLQYIKSKGSRAEYGQALSQVKLIEEFEEKHGVDVDEALNDENKFNEYLTMPGFSEPLLFAMNNYKQVIIENPDLTISEDKECSCPDRFCFTGNQEELADVLSQMMDIDDAKTLSWELEKYQNFVDEDEIIQVQKRVADFVPGYVSYLHEEWEYNINLKALSLAEIALLFDIRLDIGIVSSVLAIIGGNGQAIVKVSVEDAEKCLIREAILRKPHIIDKEVFAGTNSECVHNNYNCKYKEDGVCKISERDIVEVLDGLSQKNVFTKIRNQYKYNF